MPLYEYKCGHCDHSYSQFRCVAERAGSECPHCGSIADKVISRTTFHLNGADPGFPTASDKWERRHEHGNMSELKRLGLRP